jgi:hypothetical protein
MRESSGVASTIDDKKTPEVASRSDTTAIDSDSYLGKLGSISQPTNHSTTSTHPHTNVSVPPNQNQANEDISPEGLLQVIS